ncbi:MAG: hypothetical protein ACXVA9_12085, partial [Bdellovibrionales bacterium]
MKSLLPAILKTILPLLLTVGACAHAGDVMIIDLNNSTEEVNHCESGMNEANKKNGTADKKIHAPGRPTLVKQRDGTMKTVKVVDPAYVEQKIAEAEAAGRSIDSIIISGHDGSGNFFGENGGIRASQLGAIIARHPKT